MICWIVGHSINYLKYRKSSKTLCEIVALARQAFLFPEKSFRNFQRQGVRTSKIMEILKPTKP